MLTMAVVVGGSGCGGGAATKSHAEGAKALTTNARTRIVYVRPTTKIGSLEPGYTVRARLNGGLCLGPSKLVRGGAYSCTVGNRGFGPCWPLGKAATTAEVFCVEIPWKRSGIELALRARRKVEPAPAEPSAQRVIWAVELTSGQRCYVLEGALSVFRGVPVDFSCVRTNIELLGAPDKAQAVWTIREAVAHPNKEAPESYSAGPLGRIAVVWYGLGAAT